MIQGDDSVPKLPSGWTWTTVGALVEVIRGASPRPKGDPRYFGGDIPWIMISDVNRTPGKYVRTTRDTVTPEGAEKSRYLKAGTLILSNSGTVCVPKILGVDGCIHDGFVAFPRLSEAVDILYLYHLFDSIRPSVIQQNRQGITQVNLNTNIVRELPVPLAPSPEQQRIVARIEELFTRLDAGVEALKKIKAQLKRYRQAVLKAAFEGRLAVVQDQRAFQRNRWKALSTAMESLEQGWSPRCERSPATGFDTWGVIKTTAVQPLRYIEHENKKLPTRLPPRPGLEVRSGDLLMTRAGPRRRAGVCCLVRSTRPRLMVCDKVYRMRSKPDVARPDFLELALNCPQILEALDELKTGISDSGVNLTQKRFLEMQIPLPPPTEQERIVKEIERHFSIADEIEKTIDRSLKESDRLRQSILKRAFEGKLVPQDPNDEPAGKLLERIRAGRGE